MRSVVEKLKSYMYNLKADINAAEEQLDIYRGIKKCTIIYAESLHIHVAQDGVGEWKASYSPALLRYNDWAPWQHGFALVFDVIASEDPAPYNPPYQPEYSGRQAQIRGPKYYGATKIKIVPLNELPMYLSYPYRTPLFEKIFKGGKANA